MHCVATESPFLQGMMGMFVVLWEIMPMQVQWMNLMCNNVHWLIIYYKTGKSLN